MTEDDLKAIEARLAPVRGEASVSNLLAFLQSARQDIPALIAEVRRLRDKVARMNAADAHDARLEASLEP